MMVTMPAPAPAMHDIFMARPSHPFHDKDRCKNDKDDAENAHINLNRRNVFNFEVQAVLPHLI
jgi:hypothetical protein